jgi:hypothetical protein
MMMTMIDALLSPRDKGITPPDHRLMIELRSKLWPNFSGHCGTEGRPQFQAKLDRPESKASLCHLL